MKYNLLQTLNDFISNILSYDSGEFTEPKEPSTDVVVGISKTNAEGQLFTVVRSYLICHHTVDIC